jgi:hypothetical protein
MKLSVIYQVGQVQVEPTLLAAGRVCHYVMILIQTCSIAAMIVCIFAHFQWRWALNDRLAAANRTRRAGSVSCRRSPSASAATSVVGRGHFPLYFPIFPLFPKFTKVLFLNFRTYLLASAGPKIKTGPAVPPAANFVTEN